MKQHIRKEYGVTEGARRTNIGNCNIDLGILHQGSKEVYVSNSQTEWSNQIAHLQNNKGNYILFGK